MQNCLEVKLKPSKNEGNLEELIRRKNRQLLLKNYLNSQKSVWMSHEDAVVKVPKNFKIIASTKTRKINNY